MRIIRVVHHGSCDVGCGSPVACNPSKISCEHTTGPHHATAIPAVDAMPQPLKVVPVEDSFGSKASCMDVQCGRETVARRRTHRNLAETKAWPRSTWTAAICRSVYALCALRHAAIEQASRSHASATPLAANQRLRAGRRTLAARMAAERQPNEPSDNAHGNGRAVAWYEAITKRQRSDTKRHHSRYSFSLQNVQFYRPSLVIGFHFLLRVT